MPKYYYNERTINSALNRSGLETKIESYLKKKKTPTSKPSPKITKDTLTALIGDYLRKESVKYEIAKASLLSKKTNIKELNTKIQTIIQSKKEITSEEVQATIKELTDLAKNVDANRAEQYFIQDAIFKKNTKTNNFSVNPGGLKRAKSQFLIAAAKNNDDIKKKAYFQNSVLFRGDDDRIDRQALLNWARDNGQDLGQMVEEIELEFYKNYNFENNFSGFISKKYDNTQYQNLENLITQGTESKSFSKGLYIAFYGGKDVKDSCWCADGSKECSLNIDKKIYGDEGTLAFVARRRQRLKRQDYEFTTKQYIDFLNIKYFEFKVENLSLYFNVHVLNNSDLFELRSFIGYSCDIQFVFKSEQKEKKLKNAKNKNNVEKELKLTEVYPLNFNLYLKEIICDGAQRVIVFATTTDLFRTSVSFSSITKEDNGNNYPTILSSVYNNSIKIREKNIENSSGIMSANAVEDQSTMFNDIDGNENYKEKEFSSYIFAGETPFDVWKEFYAKDDIVVSLNWGDDNGEGRKEKEKLFSFKSRQKANASGKPDFSFISDGELNPPTDNKDNKDTKLKTSIRGFDLRYGLLSSDSSDKEFKWNVEKINESNITFSPLCSSAELDRMKKKKYYGSAKQYLRLENYTDYKEFFSILADILSSVYNDETSTDLLYACTSVCFTVALPGSVRAFSVNKDKNKTVIRANDYDRNGDLQIANKLSIEEANDQVKEYYISNIYLTFEAQ